MVDGEYADGSAEDLAAVVVTATHVERSNHVAAGVRDRHEHLKADDLGRGAPHLLEDIAQHDHLVGDRQFSDLDRGRWQ